MENRGKKINVLVFFGIPCYCTPVMRSAHVACHVAELSWILKRPLNFDPKKEEFLDDPEANRLRSRPDRVWEGER